MCTQDNTIKTILENNKAWIQHCTKTNPQHFAKWSETQEPKFLWIACSDSRVSVNTLVGTSIGEVFVHRNVGNVVSIDDTNIQAVITYAVCALNIKHIIISGHYDCGAVKAVLSNDNCGDMEEWLRNIRIVMQENQNALDTLDGIEKINALCELNTRYQAKNLAQSPAVINAWNTQKDLTIHSLIYSVKDGTLKDLNYTLRSTKDI